MREVVRAFEKYGLAHLLVDANGNVSPQVGVMRLLAALRAAEDRLLELE